MISRRPGWYVLDAGSKAISQDFGLPQVKGRESERVVKLAEGEIIALYDRDPITGCTLEWKPSLVVLGTKGWFRDACSDSTYDLSGSCFFGPCQIGLNRLFEKFGVNV